MYIHLKSQLQLPPRKTWQPLPVQPLPTHSTHKDEQQLNLSLPLSLSIYIYIYIYICREREGETNTSTNTKQGLKRLAALSQSYRGKKQASKFPRVNPGCRADHDALIQLSSRTSLECLGVAIPYLQFQHVVKSAEKAEHSETAGHTYEGTPATA